MEEQINFHETKLKYEIDSWDLNDKLKSDEQVVIIDTRSKETFNREHIPGALIFHTAS